MSDNTMIVPPEWQMDDAYGDVGSERWEASSSRVVELTEALKGVSLERDNLAHALAVYEEAMTLGRSLQSFAKCLGAKDSEDERIPPAAAKVLLMLADLEEAASPLFARLGELAEDDALWQVKPLSHWKFVIVERRNHWKRKLNAADSAFFADIERNAFMPLGTVYANLQRQVNFEAEKGNGDKETIRAARLITVLKGAPDPVLRHSTARGMNAYYDRNGELYASLLNELHGIRLTAFARAGVEPLDVSLAQNRMSREALDAIREAIRRNITTIRRAVSLRAPFLGDGPMGFEDLMAPCPEKGGRLAPEVPYGEGIQTVKDALNQVNPAMGDFIQMMVDNRWIDAKPSDKKIGGAFYDRFFEFRIPRVFSSYVGSITSISQQAHENGHAFHYWVMRDLPVVETQFPMTLAETASTFNEAVLRKTLFDKAEGDERFAMLWQEMKSAGNFLLHTMARMEFELAFLEERKKGVVSARRCTELMEEAWKKMYGDAATPDKYLWAYKLHFYKVDQLIYNYPYTVGFLLSLALMREYRVRGKDFYPFYVAMLRDTGRMTVDEIIERHFGADAKDPVFWENAMQSVFEMIEEFGEMAAKRR